MFQFSSIAPRLTKNLSSVILLHGQISLHPVAVVAVFGQVFLPRRSPRSRTPLGVTIALELASFQPRVVLPFSPPQTPSSRTPRMPRTAPPPLPPAAYRRSIRRLIHITIPPSSLSSLSSPSSHWSRYTRRRRRCRSLCRFGRCSRRCEDSLRIGSVHFLVIVGGGGGGGAKAEVERSSSHRLGHRRRHRGCCCCERSLPLK